MPTQTNAVAPNKRPTVAGCRAAQSKTFACISVVPILATRARTFMLGSPKTAQSRAYPFFVATVGHASHTMDGVVVQVSTSPGGLPKFARRDGFLTRLGFEGDKQAHPDVHGGALQAVCLFAAEELDQLAWQGYAVGPGSFGENVTTRGVDYARVRPGDVYSIGDEVRIQITKPRVPCHAVRVHGADLISRLWGPTVAWGTSGFYARVVAEGRVRSGDVVSLERAGPEPPPPFTKKTGFAADASS